MGKTGKLKCGILIEVRRKAIRKTEHKVRYRWKIQDETIIK